MSYYTTLEKHSFSPFDEALEQQKQPFLDAAMNDELMSTSIGDSNTHSSIAQFLCSLMLLQNNLNPTTTSSSEILPVWSTKYREHKTYHDDSDETMMMIETIDFVHSGTSELDISDVECGRRSVEELHYMNSTTGSKTMTSATYNRHHYTERYIHRKQEEQRRKLIIGIVATIVVTVVFIVVVVGMFIFV